MKVRQLTRLCVISGCLAASVGAQPPNSAAPSGRLIDIGGRRLHLLCTGKGSPTVIFENGASGFAIDWTLVQSDVEHTTRVCAYDRAGSGWSDPVTSSTRRTETQDLHLLLFFAREKPPYVLVGNARGALLTRAYLADYPNEVAGFVFVDPATEDRSFAIIDNRPVLIAAMTPEEYRASLPKHPVAVPSRFPLMGAPFDALPAALYAQRVSLDERLIASQPDSMYPDELAAARLREHALLSRLLATRSASPQPLGDRPTIVLGRGEEKSLLQERSHAALARLSKNSRHCVIADAGHEIHLFQPDVVTQAVLDVVRAARAKKPMASQCPPTAVVDRWAPVWSDEFDAGGSGQLTIGTRRAKGLKCLFRRCPHIAPTAYTSPTITFPRAVDGRVEARIKLPADSGVRPSFWPLGGNFPALPLSSGASGAPTDDFHVFAVEWDSLQARFYLDTTLQATVPRAALEAGAKKKFAESFSVMLNLAIENLASRRVAPAPMFVDYVRVYRRRDSARRTMNTETRRVPIP